MIQKQQAENPYVSGKAVSKWERGQSLPDIEQLEPLAGILEVTIPELLHGRWQEKEVLTEEELKQWFMDCDETMKESSAQQRKKWKKRARFTGRITGLLQNLQ